MVHPTASQVLCHLIPLDFRVGFNDLQVLPHSRRPLTCSLLRKLVRLWTLRRRQSLFSSDRAKTGRVSVRKLQSSTFADWSWGRRKLQGFGCEDFNWQPAIAAKEWPGRYSSPMNFLLRRAFAPLVAQNGGGVSFLIVKRGDGGGGRGE